MRVIAGSLRGRRYNPPAKNWPTRPTTDFSKEGLYNILQNQIDFTETKVLDLFGGSGSHTYECVSRGSIDVTYVDKFGPACNFVKRQCREWEIERFVRIVRMDALKYIQKTPDVFDFIFAGPPYGMPEISEIPDLVIAGLLLSNRGLFVLEHNASQHFDHHPNFRQLRQYGGTLFSFFQLQ